MATDGQNNISEEKEKLDHFLEHAKEYAETRFDLISLSLQEKISGIASSIVFGLVTAIIGVIIFFFLSAGVAWWLGEKWGNIAFGIFFVTGIYILIGIFLFVFKEQLIKTSVTNFLVKKINHNEDE